MQEFKRVAIMHGEQVIDDLTERAHEVLDGYEDNASEADRFMSDTDHELIQALARLRILLDNVENTHMHKACQGVYRDLVTLVVMLRMHVQGEVER